MNVYFIDPTYIKPEGWEPLLKYLKVKEVYSLIPKTRLPVSLCSIVENHIKAIYPNQEIKKCANYCAYWLRAYFETHIHLFKSDYPDTKSVPKEEIRKYSSRSPYNNLRFDTGNCLILLELESTYDDKGAILAPKCTVTDIAAGLLGYSDQINIPTHIASYCLNILHKRHQHKLYQMQSAFVLFDKYFVKTYRYNHNLREWESYSVILKDKPYYFTRIIKDRIYKISPDDFPIIDAGEKKHYTNIISEDGVSDYTRFIETAKEQAETYKEYSRDDDDGESWEDDIAEMVKDFWKECGAAASNCESWSGWD